MDENFLLKNETAVSLYQHIKDLPIIDYHCHLDAAAIAKNSRFRNITELWLGGDHYKWRLMRINGVPESHITGDAPDPEKFADKLSKAFYMDEGEAPIWCNFDFPEKFAHTFPNILNRNEKYRKR